MCTFCIRIGIYEIFSRRVLIHPINVSEIPTTLLTTPTTTTGPLILCEDRETMSNDTCCLKDGDLTLSIKLENAENWIFLPTPSSPAESIEAEAGTEKIKVEMRINKLARLGMASLKESYNIGEYTVTLQAADGREKVFGPVSIKHIIQVLTIGIQWWIQGRCQLLTPRAYIGGKRRV